MDYAWFINNSLANGYHSRCQCSRQLCWPSAVSPGDLTSRTVEKNLIGKGTYGPVCMQQLGHKDLKGIQRCAELTTFQKVPPCQESMTSSESCVWWRAAHGNSAWTSLCEVAASLNGLVQVETACRQQNLSEIHCQVCNPEVGANWHSSLAKLL